MILGGALKSNRSGGHHVPATRDVPIACRYTVAHGSVADGDLSVVLGGRRAFEPDLVAQCRARRRQKVGQPGSDDVGKHLEFGDETLLELSDARAVLVPCGADVEGDGGIGVEAEVDAGEVGIAPHHQPRRSDEDDAERDLRDDKAVLQTMPRRRCATSGLRQRGRELAARRMQRRTQTERDRGRGGGCNGEGEPAPVERQLVHPRHGGECPGEQPHQRIYADPAPATDPTAAISRTSDMTAPTICTRDPPIACRIANSRARRCSCTSKSPAMLAIAIARSSPTAPKTSHSARRYSPTRSSLTSATDADQPLSEAGYRSPNDRCTRARSASASSTLPLVSCARRRSEIALGEYGAVRLAFAQAATRR